MKIARIALAALLMLFALSATVSVQAQSVEECQMLIDQVQSDLDTIYGVEGIGGNHPERTYNSLSSKLVGASTKLDEGKYEDALQNLQNFADAVTAMRDAAKPKLSSDDANLLLVDVNAAIACVQSLLEP